MECIKGQRLEERCWKRGYNQLMGDETTTRTTRKLPIPARTVCEVHKVVIFETLVEFLAAVVQNWVI